MIDAQVGCSDLGNVLRVVTLVDLRSPVLLARQRPEDAAYREAL